MPVAAGEVISALPVPPVRSLHTVCPSEAVIRPGRWHNQPTLGHPHTRGLALVCVGVRLGLFTVMKKAVGVVVLPLLAGGAVLTQAPVGAAYRVPPAIDDGWNTLPAVKTDTHFGCPGS